MPDLSSPLVLLYLGLTGVVGALVFIFGLLVAEMRARAKRAEELTDALMDTLKKLTPAVERNTGVAEDLLRLFREQRGAR